MNYETYGSLIESRLVEESEANKILGYLCLASAIGL
jgi:hypothetical protein